LMNQDEVPVKVVTSTRTFKLDPALGGRVVSALTATTKEVEFETTGRAEKSTDVPYFKWWGEPSAESLISRLHSYDYDAHGNVTSEDHVTEDGVIESSTHAYEYRFIDSFGVLQSEPDESDVVFGLPTASESMSYTKSTSSAPYQIA